ncbi:hypothetical protein [Bacillus kexueae]|uniref:hypothetical protein n=1 Tax=Aeribacillus kexueae TaxID=2078952 RepID=UPI001FAED591|nr:hypothetical protein [Bacillus kexueae]
MKRFLVFFGSFIVIFSLFQVLSGMFLTTVYTPDISKAWDSASHLSNEVVIGGNPVWPTFFIALFSAVCAYFLSKAIKKFGND